MHTHIYTHVNTYTHTHTFTHLQNIDVGSIEETPKSAAEKDEDVKNKHHPHGFHLERMHENSSRHRMMRHESKK